MSEEPTPADFLAAPVHVYVSTACQHDLHDRCRKTCKFCDMPCACRCHLE